MNNNISFIIPRVLIDTDRLSIRVDDPIPNMFHDGFWYSCFATANALSHNTTGLFASYSISFKISSYKNRLFINMSDDTTIPRQFIKPFRRMMKYMDIIIISQSIINQVHAIDPYVLYKIKTFRSISESTYRILNDPNHDFSAEQLCETYEGFLKQIKVFIESLNEIDNETFEKAKHEYDELMKFSQSLKLLKESPD